MTRSEALELIDEDALHARAAARAGSSDFGDDDYREGLGVLLGAARNSPRLEAIAGRTASLVIDALASRRAAGLTADQKQKISMGRGLVRDDVAAVLFDEPLTVIDPHVKWLLRRKLKEVHARFRHTMVYVTHDQNEALTFADQVVVMYDGEVVQQGTPQELFERPAHRFVGYFIGSPGMNFLPCRLENEGLAIDDTDVLIAGPWAEAAGRYGNARLEIGVRPEHVGVGVLPDPEALGAKLLGVEDLGNFKLITAGLGPHRIKAKLPEEKPVPDDTAWLTFAPAFTRLYADGRAVA